MLASIWNCLIVIYYSGLPVTKEALDEVAQLSNVITVGEDFLLPVVRTACERIIPDLDGIKPTDAADTYLFLKAHYPNT